MYDMLSFLALCLLPLGVDARGKLEVGSAGDAHGLKVPVPVPVPAPASYVVILKPESIIRTVSDEIDGILRTLMHVKPKHKYNHGSFKGFAAPLSDSQLNTLRSNPKVAYIEEDATLDIQALVSKRTLTTQASSPWNLARLSHRAKGSTSYIYDSSSGSGTCSYVLDTGLYISHSDFSSRATFVKNLDTSDNSNDDLLGHGTHVAAIIGGRTYGIAKNTKLYGIKVCNKSGVCNLSDIVAGITYALTDSKTRSCPNGVTMTLSFGAPIAGSRSIQDGILAATQAGIFVVAAAGNDDADARDFVPASSPGVCAVGASDENDAKASFSNFGSTVAVFGPGVNVLSAWIGTPDATKYLNGTSMSAPHIAGLGAYVMGMRGPQNPIGLCNFIKSSAIVNVLSGIPGRTANRLAYNGAA